MATKILHLDASIGVTVDGSNLVSQWNDQSGNNYHVTQSDGLKKPLLVANALNGKPVISFNRTFLDKTFASVITVPITFFIVFDFPSASVNQNIIGACTTTNMQKFQYHSGQLKLNGDTGSYSGYAKTVPFGYTLVSARNGSSAYIKEGFTTKINHSTPLNMGSIRLGWDYYTSSGWQFTGNIAELRIYTDMTTTEAFAVEQELNAKYALGYTYENVDFITLEEEQLYPIRNDEVSVSFVTLEEEQLPLTMPEELQEFSLEEKDLDFTTLEMSVIEKDTLEETPIFSEIILEESLDPFTQAASVKRMVHANSKCILGKLI